MKYTSADRAFKKAILARDGRCVLCGETDEAVLCPHHLITRGNMRVRYDLRNSVTVCNAPRLRYVPGYGETDRPCHDIAEDSKEFFLGVASAYFVKCGYFRDEDEYMAFSGAARSGDPIPPLGANSIQAKADARRNRGGRCKKI